MASHLPNPIWFVFGGLVTFGGIYALTRYLKKKQPVEKPIDHLAPQDDHVDNPAPTPQEPQKTNPDKNETEDELVISDIIAIIKFFKGFMNPLLDISKESDAENANIVFDNLSQVIDGHGSPLLKDWFFNIEKDRKDWDETVYIEKAGQILKVFRKCGITPSAEIKVKWNEDTGKHYKKVGRIEQGEIADVVAPCWIYNNDLFEQGVVKCNK